jgi:hypothetical protein
MMLRFLLPIDKLVVPDKIPNRSMVVLDRSRATALLAKEPAIAIVSKTATCGANRRIGGVNRSLGACSRFSVGGASRLHGEQTSGDSEVLCWPQRG